MELLNAQGRVLAFIANHPECGIRDIANGMFLTRHTVWGVIGRLRRARLIRTTREGREHRYAVPDLLLRQALFALDKYG